jgi:hypothetical protein
MNPVQEVGIVSSDAGDPKALEDPNSPASIMRKAKEQQAQSAADMKYDATVPAREGFQACVVEWEGRDKYHEVVQSLFLASAVLLFLYAASPSPA